MSRFFLVIALCMPATAFAHAGHLVEVAGHTHWIAAGALAAAGAIAVWVGARASDADTSAPDGDTADADADAQPKDT